MIHLDVGDLLEGFGQYFGLIILDAAIARALTNEVSALTADELGRKIENMAEFKKLAQRYRNLPGGFDGCDGE
jgi:hypothetical protein